MNIKDFLVNVQVSESDCDCHGHLRQIDAQLKTNGKPVRIMESSDGYHVVIGNGKSIGDYGRPPAPVSGSEAERIIRAAL